VLAVVLAAHWPALSSQAITFDDGQYLVDNRLVQDPSWRSVRRFFTEVLRPSSVKGYYQPLTMTSLMVDYALGGRPTDLTPFHRTNLALHALTTILSIVLLWQLFGNAWVAAALGLLFGVHPLTIEPVAWVGERKTLLAAGFSLLCLVCYVAWTRRRGRALGGLVLLTYGLALLAKPTSTLLPGVLLLLDAWPLRRLGWRAVGEKVPLLLLGAAAASVTYLSQRNTAGVLTPGESGRVVPARPGPQPRAERGRCIRSLLASASLPAGHGWASPAPFSMSWCGGCRAGRCCGTTTSGRAPQPRGRYDAACWRGCFEHCPGESGCNVPESTHIAVRFAGGDELVQVDEVASRLLPRLKRG
jgi:hypothetical protein